MADDDPISLASLSLTHVSYDPSDPISYLCAWLSLVPQALCVVYLTLIWSTREVEILMTFAGQILCEAINFALKRIIKEERPTRLRRSNAFVASAASVTSNKSSSISSQGAAAATAAPISHGYGMPSSHAQFVFFWAATLALFLLVRHRPRHLSSHTLASPLPHQPNHRLQSTKTTTAAVATPSSTCMSHTTSATSSPPTAKPSPSLKALASNFSTRTLTSVFSLFSSTRSSTPTTTTLAQQFYDLLRATDLSLIERYTHQPWSLLERLLASAAALLLATLVAWSRTYLGYHTVRQVLVGSAAGTITAVAWFIVTAVLRDAGVLRWMLDWPVARWWRVRDLVVAEDLAQAGWEKWEGERRGARLKGE